MISWINGLPCQGNNTYLHSQMQHHLYISFSKQSNSKQSPSLSVITVLRAVIDSANCDSHRQFKSVRSSEMETLPTTTTKRGGARSKPVQTSKSSLVMAFFSCVAWLYVAGRYGEIVSPNCFWIR